jgi:hypothetical protein
MESEKLYIMNQYQGPLCESLHYFHEKILAPTSVDVTSSHLRDGQQDLLSEFG